MGYFGGPNKALANPCFKRPKLVSNWGTCREERRGEEEEEEEKMEEPRSSQKGMELGFLV